MKTLSSDMMALLAGYELIVAELFTLTLANGEVLRLTSGDGDIKIGSALPTPVTLSASYPRYATQSATTVFVQGEGTVYAINKSTQAITAIITGIRHLDLGNGLPYGGCEFDGSYLWVIVGIDGGGAGLAKYSTTGVLVGSAFAGLSGTPYLLAMGGGCLYTAVDNGVMYRLDSAGDLLASRAVPNVFNGVGVRQFFWDGANVWTSTTDNYLYKLADDLSILTTTAGINSRGIASDGSYLWVTNYAANSISKVDKSTGTVLASYTGFSTPTFITSMPNGLLAVTCSASVIYVNPLTGGIVASVAINSPQQVVADSVTGLLYIPNSTPNTVIIMADLVATGIVDHVVGNTRIERGDITTSVGLSVDECKVTLHCYQDSVIGVLSLPNFALIGGFDNAHLKIELAVMPSYGDTAVGVIHLFEGSVTDVVLDLSQIELTISSAAVLLDVQIPRVVYQPSCTHTLFDSRCGLRTADFTASRTVLASASTGYLSFSDGNAAGVYTLGRILFTSGANAGLSRTVSSHTMAAGVSIVLPLYPFPFIAAIGDSFTISLGCDKSRALCNSRFNNASQFLGWEYMPVPEVSL